MSLEGRLTVDLHRNGSGVERASINSSRLMNIAATFEGRAIEEVVAMVPVLFNVCAMAQGSAAVTACEKAKRIKKAAKIDPARTMVVLCENAREHLLRIFLDWPRFSDDEITTSNVKRVMALPATMQSALFAKDQIFTLGPSLQLEPKKVQTILTDLSSDLSQHVYGEDVEKWRTRNSLKQLQEWLEVSQTVSAKLLRKVVANNWEQAGRVAPTFLPEMDVDVLARRLSDPDAENFIAQPTWDKKTCETTALSRQAGTPLIKALLREFGAGLLTRMVARLVELSNLPLAMEILFKKISHGKNEENSCTQAHKLGYGLHQVEAARGRLVHSVKIEGDHIAHYRILAPTEWNFHKAGPMKSSLENLSADTQEELKAQADLLITAMDPCVGYQLRIH